MGTGWGDAMIADLFNVIRYHHGISLIRQKKLNEAHEYFQEMLIDNPTSSFLHLEIARLSFKMLDMPNVRKHLQELLDERISKSTIRAVLELTNWRMIASPRFFNHTPAFSPSGRMIVFASAREKTAGTGNLSLIDRPGLYRYDLDTGQERCLVDAAYYNSSPCFSPDGKKLLFLSARRGTGGNRIIDNRDNRGMYLLDLETGEEDLLVEDENKIKHPSFSPDGTKIIFYCSAKGVNTGSIYVYEREGRRQINCTPDGFESTFPSMSQDGKHFVFAAWRRDTNKDGQITLRDNSGIYCCPFTGSGEIQVSSDRYDNSFPQFSPDGRCVVYLSRRRDTNKDGLINSQDNSGIYRFDLKSKKEKVLVPDTHYNKFVSYTPDGQHLVFISNWRRGKSQSDIHQDYFEKKGIYMMDLKSWKISQVINDKYYSSHAPVVSPDNQHIAYTSWSKGLSRGLYYANIRELPSCEELQSYIQKNLM